VCNVCCALNALEAPTTFRWPNKPGIGLEVEARGEGAELAPARYRFRRVDDADLALRRAPGKAYEEPWSLWLETSDLADAMGWLGVDREWTYGDATVQAYILRKAPIQWVEAMLASAERSAAERR